MVTLVVDNADPEIKYSQDQWTNLTFTEPSPYFGGTKSMSSPGGGCFSYCFTGTSIALWSGTPASYVPYTAIIDGQQIERNIDSSGALFASPPLPHGQHEVTFYTSGSVSVDYLTVQVSTGDSTSLVGKNLIVDDYDPELLYHGTWMTTPLPHHTTFYQNTTHWSRTRGSTATFPFVGSSLAVYGVLDTSTNGIMTANFSVDDFDPVPYSAQFTGQSADGGLTSALIFVADQLPADSHTLKITLMDVTESQLLGLDYITYRPTAARVTEQPQLGTPSPATPEPSPSNDTTSVPSPATSKSTIDLTDRIGIIIGSILGGMLVLIFIVLLILIWRKRRLYHQSKKIHSKCPETGSLGSRVFDPPPSTRFSLHNLPTLTAISSSHGSIRLFRPATQAVIPSNPKQALEVPPKPEHDNDIPASTDTGERTSGVSSVPVAAGVSSNTTRRPMSILRVPPPTA
ncbi:hypothetical protein AX16_000246 [Volvariella volvacea WC 439]|nr:hypothetical protein AX16_000246 [Volvariella volvacea WC 439]